MLAPMSAKPDANNATGLRGLMRAEFALIISLGTAAILFATGNQLVEDITHPLLLVFIFLWLFTTILWSAISVVRHAKLLNTVIQRNGEFFCQQDHSEKINN